MPVELGVVEEQLDALPAALVGELLQRIAPKGRPVDDVVRRRGGLEHREPVVVPRRDRDVPDAGGSCEVDPCARVELDGVEGAGEPLVFGHGDLAILHHPLALAEQAVNAPVDEEAELRVLEPLARGESLGRSVLGPRGSGLANRQRDAKGERRSSPTTALRRPDLGAFQGLGNHSGAG